MGTITLCVCHHCREYVDLDKSLVSTWLFGDALRHDDDDLKGWEQWQYIYEMVHAHKALRFVFMHPDCRLDIVYSHDDDWDRYIDVIKNYKEITFAEPIEGKQWSQIWERQEDD